MTPSLAFLGIGPPEMILILIVALLVYGGRLPEVARNVGRGVAKFRRGLQEIKTEFEAPIREAASSLEDEDLKLTPASNIHLPKRDQMDAVEAAAVTRSIPSRKPGEGENEEPDTTDGDDVVSYP